MHFWKWPSVSNKNRFFNYINNSALPKNNSLSESTLTLTWTSAKLGGGTRVFLRWTGYSGDLTGPSCFNWGAEMAVQGRALNTHGPIFEITLCACSLDMFLLFSMWTFSEMSQTKPAHTPHTVVKLQVLTDFSFFFFLYEYSHVFFSTQRRVSLHHTWYEVRFMTGNQSSHSPLVTTSMRTTANTRNLIFLWNKPKKRSDSFIVGKKKKKNKITLKSIKTH